MPSTCPLPPTPRLPLRTDARPARRGRGALRTLGAVVVLTAVVTAGAPSVIRIAPGDTLSGLALRHGTSVSALRALNGLQGNATIYAGATLKVPGSGSGSGRGSVASAGERSHTVRGGDTLSHLAVRYGTTVSALRARNGLPASGLIRAGQRLAVPAGGASAGSGSSSSSSSAASSSGSSQADGVSTSVARNRAVLRSRSHPSKAAVRRMVAATARRHGVSPSLAVSVAYHESGFQQRVVSGVNAIGVMQVLPSTGSVLARQHGLTLDLLDTQDNITAGVLLLRQLQRSVDSEQMVLAAYYQGLGSIARKGLLPQTHDYIESIGHLKKRFRNG